MLQFNLLPDVKLEYVKTQRTKHLLTLLSLAASAAGIGILVLSFVTVDVVQKVALNNLNGDIKKYSKQLKEVPDLDKILTVQNQLSTLTDLHNQKPMTARIFQYISQVTPSQASLNKLNVDFSTNMMTIGGKTPGLDVVSTYTDTLKATMYQTDDPKKGKSHAFNNVVLTSFNRDDKGASFTITCGFDPTIYASDTVVQLTVPVTAGADQSSVFDGGSK